MKLYKLRQRPVGDYERLFSLLFAGRTFTEEQLADAYIDDELIARAFIEVDQKDADKLE